MKPPVSSFKFHASSGAGHSPSDIRHCKSRRAFTLIEIMVSIAIFMIIIAAIFSTWALVMRATQVGQSAAATSQRERVALRTIEDGLMCVQSFQASQKYYFFNVENGDSATLSFAARVPDVFPRNGKFGDFNLRRLTFQLEPGEDGLKNLVLRQNPILMELDEDEKKFPLVLAHNVKEFLVECWNTNKFEWVTKWDDTNSIPVFIRVGLVLGSKPDFNTRAPPDRAIVRAFAVPSAMMPAQIQHGTVGGPPGGRPPIAPNPNPVRTPVAK